MKTKFHIELMKLAKRAGGIMVLLRQKNLLQRYCSTYRRRVCEGDANMPRSAYNELITAFPPLKHVEAPKFAIRELPGRIKGDKKTGRTQVHIPHKEARHAPAEPIGNKQIAGTIRAFMAVKADKTKNDEVVSLLTTAKANGLGLDEVVEILRQ